jgi:uncharacterized protein (UPF0276 family)
VNDTHDIAGCGIGLRREHHEEILASRPPVPFFEVISENFMVPGGRPRHVLARVRRDYPVVLHGVSLNVGADEPLRRSYLRKLKELVDFVEPALVSDHLCFTGLAGESSHDLLPVPFTEEAVATVAAKVREVQDVLGRRILLENISTYVAFTDSTLPEADFLVAVLEEADCGLLLDVNNLYVNARNHGIDPLDALDLIPPKRVHQMHLAGHEDHGTLVIDTHDAPVADAVWSLYAEAIERFGPVPTILERDGKIPPLAELLGEASRASSLVRAVRSRRMAPFREVRVAC